MYFDFKIFEGLFGTKDLLYKYQSEQHKAHVILEFISLGRSTTHK